MLKEPLINQRTRSFILQGLVLIMFIIIWGQLIHVQIIKSPGLISKAKKRFEQKKLILRGEIRDRNGELLVLDLINYDLYNNIRDLKKIPEEKIAILAQIIKKSPKEVKEKLVGKIDTKLFSNISEEEAKKIKDNEISFVYLVPTLKRNYPHGNLAAHLIGFVNNDHKGQHGVEYFHEKLLTKKADNLGMENIFPRGTDIVLTIDSLLQKFSENELKETVKRTKAQRGTVLVLSPKTGEVLAWAVYPSYDPNKFYKAKDLKNWALTDVYEPGSTFKIITLSSALEAMAITKDSTFRDEGFLKIGNRIMRNHHHTEPKTLNLLELLKHSSNVATGQIGLLMEPKTFYNQIKKFKISEKTNIDLPGESKGLLTNYKKWKEIDKATTAIGQGSVSVTPIQLASAVAAVANHGVWIQPHILKGIWEPNYQLINDNPYKITKEQIISAETADTVSDLLRQSVKENVEAMSYIAGNIEGYEVAGKTGTAQKISPDGNGYLAGHTIASFIGYLPAKNPELLVLAVVDDPQTDGRWGNTIAGPLFNKVALYAAKRFIEE